MANLKHLGPLGLLVASLALTACGGRAGAQNAAQALSTVNRAAGFLTGLRLGQDPSTSIAAASPGFSNRPASFMLSTLDTNRTGACGYTSIPEYASRTDADGDGIPVTIKYTYDYDNDACGVDGAGSKYTFKGTYDLADSDDTKKWLSGGFTSTWNYTGTYHSPSITSETGRVYPEADYTYTGKGNYLSRQSGSSFVNLGDYNGRTVFTVGSRSGAYNYVGKFSYVVTPDSLAATQTWVSGKISMSGSWTYSGQVPYEEDEQGNTRQRNGDVDITFTATTIDLTYDNTCTKYWKSGTFRFDVGNNHVFDVVYDCTTEKYYYDGKEYDPTADN